MSDYIDNQIKAPNLEDIRQDNDGGAIALRGFDYQFHFAAQKCLEMLDNPSKYEFVSLETHDDIVVKLQNGDYEFYQVKLKANERWDLSQLKSRGVWSNFIKTREKFGTRHTFWFVSDQTAQYTTRSGRKQNPDLGQMKVLTRQGFDICKQNERDMSNAEILIERLQGDWGFTDRTEAESFFWHIRILSDYEHENGLESSNILKLQKLIEHRGNSVDSENSTRIYMSIINLLRERVQSPEKATYEEIIEMRKVRCDDLEACISHPFTAVSLNQFRIGDEYEEPQRRDLREKTQILNPNWATHFIESRNYFTFLYRQQVSYSAPYIGHLRQSVWNICHKKKVLAVGVDKPVQTYREILNGLENLAQRENNKQPPFEVTEDYLHGMMCQLTAECHHDWHLLE